MFALGKDDKGFFFFLSAEPEEPEVDVHCVVLPRIALLFVVQGH